MEEQKKPNENTYGKISALDGNPEPLRQLMSLLVQFTPHLEIMPGTKGQ